MSYCLSLFIGCEKSRIQELQVIQNGAARIICNAHFRTSRNVLFDRLDWLSVNQLGVYFTLLMVFNIRRSGEPEYLAGYLLNDTRSHRIKRENTRLSLALQSFVFRGSQVWNSLPSNIRLSSNSGIFKSKVKRWIAQQIPRFIDE